MIGGVHGGRRLRAPGPEPPGRHHVPLRTHPHGRTRAVEATAFAADIAAKASSITGVEVSTWQVQFGAPLGTFIWTATVEQTADMATAGDKLVADNGYLEAILAADHLFDGHVEDAIAEIVGTAGDGGHRGEYATSVMAQCNAGHIGDAMAFGLEMMELVHGATGRDGLFTRGMYGPRPMPVMTPAAGASCPSLPYMPQAASGVIFTLADTAAQIDEGNPALAANPDYLTKVDASADLFAPGSGHGRLSRRIA